MLIEKRNGEPRTDATKIKPDAEADGPQSPTQAPGRLVYPIGLRLMLILGSLFVAMFLVALDRLIVTTAIPQITNAFNSAGDVAWYGTAYLLTNCSCQLIFGKLYTIYSVKSTFMAAVFLFEVGSTICGAAPSSVALIIGRAIAGMGSGGVMSGAYVILVYAMPLHERPKYQGLFGAVFGLASVLGPIIGGALTTSASWRWCFYINLPLGGVVMILIFFLLQLPQRNLHKVAFVEGLKRLNLLSMLTLVGGVISLCLALQWGGSEFAWNSGRIVALVVVAFACVIAFSLLQVLQPKHAILPPSVISQRSVASGFWTMSCLGAHQMIFFYFLPIWFQVIKRHSAVKSGTDIIPTFLTMTLAVVTNGILVSRIGYYIPSMLTGICLAAIAAGLLTTIDVNISMARLAGYQFLYGLGLGITIQGPNMAAQTVLPTEQVAIGASLMLFGQQLFGAIFISVAQNMLDTQLAKRLADFSQITPELIKNSGATELLHLLPPNSFHLGLQAYNESLRACFQIGMIIASMTIVGALAMEWRSMKKCVPHESSDERKVEEGAARVSDDQEHDDSSGESSIETETGGEKIAQREKSAL